MFEFPYCPQNEIEAKRFLSKFHEFTNNNFETPIKWFTKKIKNLCLIMKIMCLSENVYYYASSNGRQRKNLEASFIAILVPSLNNQIDTKKLILFHNEVT